MDERDEPMPAPKRRRSRMDIYDLRSLVRFFATAGLMGIGGYALLMAGLWLQAHQ